MPIHDWKRAPAGLFHHFHQRWTGELCDGLNSGVLPAGFFALIEQKAIGLEPDILALSSQAPPDPSNGHSSGIAVATTPPKARFVTRLTDRESYTRKANRVAIRNSFGELVAIIELVSPGNKDGKHAIRAFIEKVTEFLARGINVLIIDLFPPTPRDPQGIHKAIWDEIRDEPFELPADKSLTVAAYEADPSYTAYVEPVGVGDVLPPMPIFLDPGRYVLAPLEETYMRTWEKCPREMRERVENPPHGVS